MGEHQWYVHLSRVDGSDLSTIKSVLRQFRVNCEPRLGAQDPALKYVIGFGPTLLRDLTNDIPNDFQAFETVASSDGSGREAKGTQEELLLWLHGSDKGLVWRTQWEARQALKGHMRVARETITFIYGASLDMSGFIDGTGNPDPASRDREVAIVPDGQPGAGGSHILAQRWVHDLDAFEKLPIEAQEAVFGRKKPDSARMSPPPATSHLAHVELREGKTADETKPKRNEVTRRSTPYALHDGTVGLYFLAFCKDQAPFRERLRAMYGLEGGPRDQLTDYSNPASGSFYFAPSLEVLDAALAP
jgi:putative iron-dependent peroxidase